jgi:hypothetical protein
MQVRRRRNSVLMLLRSPASAANAFLMEEGGKDRQTDND